MTDAADIPSPSSGTDRIRAWRKARRDAGQVKLEFWVPQGCRDDVRAAVRTMLGERFAIEHCTIQTEGEPCEDGTHLHP